MPLISPTFDVKSIIFSNFGQGPFPKIAGKSPEVTALRLTRAPVWLTLLDDLNLYSYYFNILFF